MPLVAKIIRRRRRRKHRRQRASGRSAFWNSLLFIIPGLLLLLPLLSAFGLAFWLYGQAARHLPTPQESVLLDAGGDQTRFYDRTGNSEIYALADGLSAARRWLPLADLPPYFVEAALLAQETAYSAQAGSFDALATLLQLWRYIAGLPLESPDSITSHLARETLLPLARDSGLDARLLEIVFVAESKRLYSAEELLEWRLNSAYYGRAAFGLSAAAQVYFGKEAEALSLAEAALLAALLDAPAPTATDSDLRARATALLSAMQAANLIDGARYEAAVAADLDIRSPALAPAASAPSFVEYARQQAQNLLAQQGLASANLLARGGLRITTTLDMDLQAQAECLLHGHLRRLQGQAVASDCAPALSAAASDLSSPPDSGALALIDVNNGQILSLVGPAAVAGPQPALLLQPFVYVDAFARRDYTPASMVFDLPRAYPTADTTYRPANPAGRYHGPLSLRAALAAGLLPPAVEIASEVGMASIIRVAQTLGFNSLSGQEAGLDLLEGGGAVSALDAAYAYTVFASLGQLRGLPTAPLAVGLRGRDPVAVLKIEDAAGQVLWSFAGASANQSAVVEPSLAYILNDILSDSAAREAVLGQADAVLQLDRPAAVIDGLSADQRDAWTLGYTADLALAVQLGRQDAAPLSLGAYERVGTAPIWRALLDYAGQHLNLPPRPWLAPPDIEEYLVCEISGALPAKPDHCPTRREIVPRGAQLPPDTFWQTVEINSATGLLATVNTPANLRQAKSYFLPPADVMDWWLDNGKPLSPTSFSAEGAAATQAVQLTAPADYAYLGATVEIAGRINQAGAESWLLEYGAGVDPERWLAIGERQPAAANGEIAATWLTALLSDIHTLRLTVTFADGSSESDSKRLTFDNTPPAVKLSTDTDAGSYATGQALSLLAEATDNLVIERVEFYRDDTLLGVDYEWPYGYAYTIEGAGDLRLRALAYDQVGNRAAAALELTVEG